jgi:protein-S-isoprenylcysteine O-methyltransferase Ste14
MVQVRTAMLRKRGIRVMVFGQTDISDFLLVPLVLAIAYTVLANTFGLPIWNVLIRPFWNGIASGWAGLALCFISVAGFGYTLACFGDSFRVGIDEIKPDKLITNGMFKFSRNPIYVCFVCFFVGMFIIHRNIIIAVAVVLFTLAIHRQVLREEIFLASYYGLEYELYRKKVRRYL